MAGQDVSYRGPESGLLPDLSVLAGLVSAFVMFLFIAMDRSPDRPASTGEPPLPSPVRESAPAAFVPDLPAKSHEARETSLRKPVTDLAGSHAKPFLAASASEESFSPQFEPAMAEKPSVLVIAKAVPETPVMDRHPLPEDELASSLLAIAIPVGLDGNQALIALERVRLAKPNPKRPQAPEEVVLALLKENRKRGLPYAKGSECELEQSKAEALDVYSRMLTRQIALSDGSVGRHPRTSHLSDRDQNLALALKNGRKWQAEEAIPAMRQILQVESRPVRLRLVEMLEGFGTPEATEALLNRAVYDLSADVRESANTKLKGLYHSGYRPVLLDALRYPWPEVAWNAAESLAALDDTEAVPELIELLDLPDPALPSLDESGQMVVKELVGINHVQNCLLCHPASRSKTDRVRRVVPTGLTSSSGSRYGGSSSPGIRVNDVLLRADITYLRQDFSVMHSTGHGFHSHTPQRFDYLVRTRDASPDEIARAESPGNPSSYPQRNAVLYALRKLTGQNPGPDSEDWRQLEF